MPRRTYPKNARRPFSGYGRDWILRIAAELERDRRNREERRWMPTASR